MVTRSPQFSLERLTEQLDRRPQSVPWHRRVEMAAWVAEQIRTGNTAVHHLLVRQLSRDPKWEVRKKLAEVLEYLPDELAVELGSALRADANAYVAGAAVQALRRRDGASQQMAGQKDAALLLGQYSRMQARHGKTAARGAHTMALTRYRKLARSLTHDLGTIVSNLASTEPLAASLERQGHEMAASARQLHETKVLLQGYLEQLQAYTRNIGLTRHAVRLLPLVRHAEEVARGALKEQGFDLAAVSLKIAVPATLKASANQQAFTVALVNIIKNAYEAHCAGGGQVLGAGSVTISAQSDDAAIRLAITDTGCGMTEDELSAVRTFIPGHRSQSKPISSGFGLPTAYEIILAHEGDMEVASTPGEGTTVTIALPQPQKGN